VDPSRSKHAVVVGRGHPGPHREPRLPLRPPRSPATPGGSRRSAPAVALAPAGLLDGYEPNTQLVDCDGASAAATPGWSWPTGSNARTGPWTSAGGHRGHRFFLAFVDADHGPSSPHRGGGWLCSRRRPRRPGASLSAQLRAQVPHPDLAELQTLAPDHLGRAGSVGGARRPGGHEPPHLRPVLRPGRPDEPPPRSWRTGVETAAPPRTTDLTMGRRRRLGINSPETLHRAFQDAPGRPHRYRQHFTRRLPDWRPACRSPSACTRGTPPSTPSDRSRCSRTCPTRGGGLRRCTGASD